MENLSFILWMCLWPLTCSIDSYFSAKTRQISGEKNPNSFEKFGVALIQLTIWIMVAKLL